MIVNQPPFEYVSSGPWTTSVLDPRGNYSVITCYELRDAVQRTMARATKADSQWVVIVDAEGVQIYASDQRDDRYIITREVADIGMSLIPDDLESQTFIMMMADAMQRRRGQ